MGPGTQRVHYANYTVIVIPPCETSESFHSENLILNGKWLKVRMRFSKWNEPQVLELKNLSKSVKLIYVWT